MKSYTDLEQSKRLAEILPLESADMCYPLPCEDGDKPLLEQGGFGSTPCWSLAALLSVIKPINENTYSIIGTLDGGAIISFDEITNVMYQEKEIIDAVFEMILKLHEQKIL